MTTTDQQQRPPRMWLKRLGIVVIFALLGGFIGGLSIGAVTIGERILGGSSGGLSVDLILVAIAFGMFGAAAGAPFAAATGAIYALLPRPAQRIIVAPVLGWGVTFAMLMAGLAPLQSEAPNLVANAVKIGRASCRERV